MSLPDMVRGEGVTRCSNVAVKLSFIVALVILCSGRWVDSAEPISRNHRVQLRELHNQDSVHWQDREREDSKATYGETQEQALQYRTAFHFQPTKNWMNDPNGMMYYKGWYHLFYQYNPYGALWGNIVWGHVVSKDLIHWKYLEDGEYPIVGGPDWYDLYGAWSGSTTFLPDGTPAMLYTGWSNVVSNVSSLPLIQIQTQNLALPVDKDDPLLRKWYKSEANPVIVAEPWMDATKFRDPTEAWKGEDGSWRILIGARKTDNVTGTAHLYRSKDFVKWEYSHDIDSLKDTGMWECPDFFPVGLKGKVGLGVSANFPGIKHVLKVSLDNTKHDHYSVGVYDVKTETFKADDSLADVGIGLRYDYGKYYASKSFFDQKTGRRILFGWVNESDSDLDAITSKGWSGIQALPRQLWLDPKTGVDLIQTPVEEVDGLHKDKVSKSGFTLAAGSLAPVEGVHGPQLDVQIKFYKPEITGNKTKFFFNASDGASLQAGQVCSQTGAAHRGYLGPFGVLVLSTQDHKEQTAVYYYLQVRRDGKWDAIICSDQSRSTLQTDVDTTVYGTYVRVLESEKYLTLRTIVDHSVVETFAQGGRTVVTSRVYPTLAVNDGAYFYLFNNGVGAVHFFIRAFRSNALNQSVRGFINEDSH
ncbi:hypothetical protein R1sor_000080 [Riccia sorocarpa]|uniref:Beta-fructofuranosidase n=1 Tax=Riccia sorocarpa TaxID=122646 RepID=A0ABD3GSX3_9MARC